MEQISVVKGDGTREPLDYGKIEASLRKSGAGSALVREVIDSLSGQIKDGMPTSEIYKIAFKELQELRPGAAARFGLKAALAKLGPEGYPFETFMGALLKGRGYKTQLRTILRGKCVSHEIDVIATRGAIPDHKATKCIIECKFHNSPYFKCHIQSALYSWARFLDVRQQNPDIDSVWLATNTKFSQDTIQYADCVGLRLVGWSFPQNESIQVRIEENKLDPITLLPHLDRRSFEALHGAEIILVKEILDAPADKLRALRFTDRDIERLKEDAKKIMSSRG